MWFEPTQFPDVVGVLGGFIPAVGFNTPPGGEIGSTTHILNDHTYCCQMSATECSDGEPQIEHAAMCEDFHRRRLTQRKADANRLGVPLFITEFGACLSEGPCTQEINQVANNADDQLAGWAYWQFKYFEDLTTSAGTGSEGFYEFDAAVQEWKLQDWKVKALARTYLMTTQGALIKHKYNPNDQVFKAQFTINTSITNYSELYLNKQYNYPKGYFVTISVDGQKLSEGTEYSADATDVQRFKFTITDTSLNGKIAKVHVVPL